LGAKVTVQLFKKQVYHAFPVLKLEIGQWPDLAWYKFILHQKGKQPFAEDFQG
jgi:hypothetical protein